MKNYIETIENQAISELIHNNQNNLYTDKNEYIKDSLNDKNITGFNLKDLIHPFEKYKEEKKNTSNYQGKEDFDIRKIMPQFFSIQYPNSNGNTLTLQDKDNFLHKEDQNKCEMLSYKEDQMKETLQVSNNLEFLSTLIRLKSSSDNLQPQITVNTFFNNDESRIQVKELIDLVNQDKKQINNRNEISSNNPYEAESLSFIHNKSNSNNAIKLAVPHPPVVAVSNQSNNINKNLQNNYKKPYISSVNGYFNRRHTEVVTRVERMRKEKMMKEQAEMKKKPEINKRSKIIAERLSSKHYLDSHKQLNNNLISPKSSEKQTELIKDLYKSNGVNINNHVSNPSDINSIIELSIAEFKNNRKENKNSDINLILNNLDSQKKNSFTKRTKSSEPNFQNSFRKEEKDHIPLTINEDKDINSINNNNEIMEPEIFENNPNLNLHEKNNKHFVEENNPKEIENIQLFQTNKKRYYFKEFNNPEHAQSKDNNKLVDELIERSQNPINSDIINPTANYSIQQKHSVKIPMSYESKKDHLLDEMIKNHCIQNKQENIPKALQIEDLMNSIAQYNQIAMQSNNLNKSEAARCSIFSSRDIKSGVEIDSQSTNKHKNCLNNSVTSINSKGKKSLLINSSKKNENNVVYVDLRNIGNNNNLHNSNLLCSIRTRESFSTNSKPQTMKNNIQTNRESIKKNAINDEILKKISSKRNKSSSINLKKNYNSAANIPQNKKTNMIISELVSFKKPASKISLNKKSGIKSNSNKYEYIENISKKKRSENSTKLKIFQVQNIQKK